MITRWSPAEDEMLAGLAGDLPWPQVVKTYKRWASQHDMPKRSANSMKHRCMRCGLSRSAVGEFVTTGFVAEMLEICTQSVQEWISREWLPSTQYGSGRGRLHYIRRRDLRRLARERPELFGGQSESTLVQLLDSEVLAAQIVAMNLKRIGKSKPVVCIERGRRYESIRAAARDVYIDPRRINDCLDKPHRTAAGYHWRTA